MDTIKVIISVVRYTTASCEPALINCSGHLTEKVWAPPIGKPFLPHNLEKGILGVDVLDVGHSVVVAQEMLDYKCTYRTVDFIL
jgi:hypothetical protein